MGYNKEALARVKVEYSKKHREAIAKAETLRAELHEKIPALAEIDGQLSLTGLEIMDAITACGSNIAECIDRLKESNFALQREREALLAAHGLFANVTDPVFECEKCTDTGYVGLKMCDCMRRALIYASMEISGLGGLLKTQSFKNFSLDYYKADPKNFDEMTRVLADLKKFCREFKENSGKSFLFFGHTGLGKTHLSTAIATSLIERGFDVFYVTCTQMIYDFESKRFSKNLNDSTLNDVDRYYSADLLIIDDLGTEQKNQFTMSIVYELINFRMINQKSVIINTNLMQKELMERYEERIASRIVGTYRPVFFRGKDIRLQKISQKPE